MKNHEQQQSHSNEAAGIARVHRLGRRAFIVSAAAAVSGAAFWALRKTTLAEPQPVYAASAPAKKDAPSGTLLKLVDEIRAAGYTASVSVASNRAGATPGTHEIGFDSSADTITLRHTARNREGFALGAIKAAEWIAGKKGFYER